MLKLRVIVGLFLARIMMMHLRNINLRKNLANNLNIMGAVDWRGLCRERDGARNIGRCSH